MHVVIFEVRPKPGCTQDYLDIAAKLRPELQKIDGFVSVERFQSLTDPSKLLSLSTWRDETAVKHWRRHAKHGHAQVKGRAELFADYRIRVAAVIRDYGMTERDQAPQEHRIEDVSPI
jgi:heme-degrading monooxygenase HmoA